jgi:hypothetical protein
MRATFQGVTGGRLIVERIQKHCLRWQQQAVSMEL